jgi:predicted lipoprotein with Yx(FWY)xxD motif
LRRGLTVLAVAVLIAGCQESGPSTHGPVVPPAPNVVLRVGATATRPAVLIDGSGHTLYVSANERGGRQHCTGRCLQVWPLVLLTAQGRATSGGTAVPQSAITVAQLPDGRAVSFHHFLLHRYVGDSSPGGSAGQGVGGEWSTITPSGAISP